MTPTPLAARRLPLLGCALAAVAALALSACGSDGAATAESAPTTQAKQQPMPGTRSGQPCPAKVASFTTSLGHLRRQLEVGLSYEQYAAKVKSLRTAYGQIPIDHLTIGCLTNTGTPAEQAFDKYVDAANAWGECLADAACTTATIEPVLQRKWRLASRFLSRAR